MSLFSSLAGGFQLTFANGLTISVMFRGGNYCEHKEAHFNIAMDNLLRDGFHRSKDTEIAIWESTTNGRGRWISIGYDKVSGWHSTDEVAFIIFAVQSAKNFEDLQSRVKHNDGSAWFTPPVALIG